MGLPAHLGAGRFDVRRCLGRGGMGTVYEAIDRQTNNTVAIKLLGDLDAQRLYRFKKEFRALADLQHRHLVRLHELIADDDRWLITMELIDGHDSVGHRAKVCLQDIRRSFAVGDVILPSTSQASR